MSFIKYLKERWLTYIFILLAFGFAAVVYRLDASFNITQSNANYIAGGWLILFLLFVAIDYGILCTRVNKFKKYCSLNASSQDIDEFSYPVDREYAKELHEIAENMKNLRQM